MGTLPRLSAILFTVTFFVDLHFRCSTGQPLISASPGLLPYVTAPNMSSFFPSSSSAASPKSEASAPIPSSGEFIGRSSSSSAKFDGNAVIFGVRLWILSVICSVSLLSTRFLNYN
ncbi:uncharacterized protein LOC116111306 [Pistacia vera]|uniref:uncharacterized protein LOC116111306 n=1 Tax=Pistacia vera TaxID=55513 RepID=UPI001263C71C|nr:uncharacterized protein LOC116111306 [Pistacia vera]